MGSYPTLSPLPAGRSRQAVCFLWRYPWGRPRRALPAALSPWSPDFPRPRAKRDRDRPAVWSAGYVGACGAAQASRLSTPVRLSAEPAAAGPSAARGSRRRRRRRRVSGRQWRWKARTTVGGLGVVVAATAAARSPGGAGRPAGRRRPAPSSPCRQRRAGRGRPARTTGRGRPRPAASRGTARRDPPCGRARRRSGRGCGRPRWSSGCGCRRSGSITASTWASGKAR